MASGAAAEEGEGRARARRMLALSELFADRVLTPAEFAAAQRRAAGGRELPAPGSSRPWRQLNFAGLLLLYAAARLEAPALPARCGGSSALDGARPGGAGENANV